MTRSAISVTIITLNEEKNIARAIQSVLWAEEIIVIDSGSSDQTLQIAKNLGAKVIHHPWKGYGQQKNYAQNQATHDWILNLDADEVIPDELKSEIIQNLEAVNQKRINATGFLIPRKTFYLGRWIRHGGWYPNYLVRLADRRVARWTEPHVHEALEVKGELIKLKHPIEHHAFSCIQDQIITNLRFSHLGSQDLKRHGKKANLGRLILKPLGKFVETYFLKRGFLDGLAGFIISINAAHSMFLKYAYLCEANIKRESTHH